MAQKKNISLAQARQLAANFPTAQLEVKASRRIAYMGINKGEAFGVKAMDMAPLEKKALIDVDQVFIYMIPENQAAVESLFPVAKEKQEK